MRVKGLADCVCFSLLLLVDSFCPFAEGVVAEFFCPFADGVVYLSLSVGFFLWLISCCYWIDCQTFVAAEICPSAAAGFLWNSLSIWESTGIYNQGAASFSLKSLLA